MFAEAEGSRKTIGDVDVVYHDGLYHLFHLVLPNHDFIAHAVSTNGINWRRVNNALFIGDPGSWDDLMLWTMHVTPDPYEDGRWRMFYTGLSRRDQGRVQRIGLAVSDDLFHWQKMPVNWRDSRGPHDPEEIKRARQMANRGTTAQRNSEIDESSCFPLEPDARYYESSHKTGRAWVSFRDPFYFRDDGEGWLIQAARVNEGPMVRRGCVGLFKETEPNCFEAMPSLHHPNLYDDIEVPNLFCLDGEYYLVGSIREDAKIRYWHTDKIGNPWRTYHDNILMAQGNYAGRVAQDDKGWLLWNFFSVDVVDQNVQNLMPPPKRLARTDEGLLRVTTFEGFEDWVENLIDTHCINALKQGIGEPYCSVDGDRLDLQSEAGFQAFVFDERLGCFRFQAHIRMRGKGKCGIIFRLDPQTHDGYYLSLDLLKGVAQMRSWRTGPHGSGENMMQFRTLQVANWYCQRRGEATIQLIAFGSYLELAIDHRIVLSLADQTFHHGLLGVYLESAHMELSQVNLHRLRTPFQSDEHLVTGYKSPPSNRQD